MGELHYLLFLMVNKRPTGMSVRYVMSLTTNGHFLYPILHVNQPKSMLSSSDVYGLMHLWGNASVATYSTIRTIVIVDSLTLVHSHTHIFVKQCPKQGSWNTYV